MTIDISQTADDKIWVNGKLMVLDMNGNWVSNSELTPNEQTAALDFIQNRQL